MNQENQKVGWYYGRTFVILMRFVVLGPLGLPVLWKSPRFSGTWKWALTVLAVAWMCVLMVGIVQTASEVMRAIDQHVAGNTWRGE